jgi:hypothetical protein
MSDFDPSKFLDSATTEQSTRRPPLPVGDYVGTIDSLEVAQWQSKDGTKAGIKFDLKIKVDTAGAADQPPTLTMNDSILLDLNDGGMIDYGKGKNGKLMSYREALDMNKAGETFVPRNMAGRMLKVKLKHEEYQGNLYERVDRVAKA